MSRQLKLIHDSVDAALKASRSSTFIDNLSLPVHRWFRYSAGFSGEWVREVLEREKANGRVRVFDPFVGSGTVLLEAETCGVSAMGVDPHPFISRVASAKLLWRHNPEAFTDVALQVLDNARRQTIALPDTIPKLLQTCYPPETLKRLYAIKQAYFSLDPDDTYTPLVWLALVSILRSCSPAGTAQWQYIQPKKSKANYLDPFVAFEAKVALMADDMAYRKGFATGPQAGFFADDARDCASIPDDWAQLVITSPPYANNFDYADATRLEMTFMGEISGWSDLQDTVRTHLIRACTQHVAKHQKNTYELLEDPLLAPIKTELLAVCQKIDVEREFHGGKKPYHTMLASYFLDLAQVWHALKRVCTDDALVCFVVGDSAPYGIHAPVDVWLGELALSAGFQSYSFEKTRDRNIKWKNRKHRHPLHEGRLWVKGA